MRKLHARLVPVCLQGKVNKVYIIIKERDYAGKSRTVGKAPQHHEAEGTPGGGGEICLAACPERGQCLAPAGGAGRGADCGGREDSNGKIPSLAFVAPLLEQKEEYLYDVPFGAQRRGPLHLDRPANSFVAAANGLVMMSEARYGFRCVDDSICLKLLRSSTDPDPIPEICIHRMMFALSLPEDQRPDRLLRKVQAKYTGISVVAGQRHEGALPASGAFLEHTGAAVISAVKAAEYVPGGWTLRLYEVLGQNSEEKLVFSHPVKRAYVADTTEKHILMELQWEGSEVCLQALPYQVMTVILEF